MYKMLIGKPEGKRPLGKTKFRWKDNIKLILNCILKKYNVKALTEFNWLWIDPLTGVCEGGN